MSELAIEWIKIPDGDDSYQKVWIRDSAARRNIATLQTTVDGISVPEGYDSTPEMDGTGSAGSATTWARGDHVHPSDTSKADISHTHTRAECNDALLSATYAGVVRSSTSYSNPYTPSYFYFGQFVPADLDLPAHVTYHLKAYGTSNSNYLLDATVRWDVSTNGIYKAYWIWNNNNSTSYYPFGYHSLFQSNNATISASDGCYFGGYFGTSTGYGQNPTSVERTIEVEILEAENCSVTLNDSVVFFDDTDNMPSNLVQTSTSYAFNTTNFTVVNVTTGTGLQETGDGNTNYYDRMVWNYAVLDTAAASGRYSIGFMTASGDFVGVAQSSSTGTSKTLNTTVEIDPNLCFYQLTTTYAASKTIAASALYTRYPLVDIRYSCNQGSWMTARQPVYLILNSCDDGYFTVNSTVFTHTLPTSADGYYYKFVGIAYDSYRFVFEPREALYYHDGTKLCTWSPNTDVSVNQTLTSGTEIGSITVNDTETVLYAPSVSSVTVDSEISSTSTNPVQNAAIYSALSGKADLSDIPTNVSELTNDSGYITDAGVTSFNGSTGAITYMAPVTSVNGSTGAVTIDVPTAVSELTNDAGYITDSAIPTNVSEFTNDAGYLTSYTETDPTVPDWAKASSKPTYTASEVGALPDTTTIPTATSELTNDSGFITSSALPTAVSELTNDAGYITSSAIPTNVSDFTNDAGYITSSSVPSASSTTPVMDGTAAVGSETAYARGDHVHPSDTSKQDALTSAQLAACNSGITADDLAVNDASVLCTVTPTVPTLTNGSHYSTFGGCYYYKIGRRVTVHIGVSGITANTSIVLWTLPTGYKPYALTAFVGNASSFNNYSRCRVNTDGEVLVYSAATYALAEITFDAFS